MLSADFISISVLWFLSFWVVDVNLVQNLAILAPATCYGYSFMFSINHHLTYFIITCVCCFNQFHWKDLWLIERSLVSVPFHIVRVDKHVYLHKHVSSCFHIAGLRQAMQYVAMHCFHDYIFDQWMWSIYHRLSFTMIEITQYLILMEGASLISCGRVENDTESCTCRGHFIPWSMSHCWPH